MFSPFILYFSARRKRNKGMGQFLMFSIISGITIMVPILLKTIFAMAVKALVAGKLALLLTALSYFHKSSSGDHHPHDTHEANIRRHVMI